MSSSALTKKKKIFAAAPNTEVNPGVIVREDGQQSGSLFEQAVFLFLLFLLFFCSCYCILGNLVFGFEYFVTELLMIVVMFIVFCGILCLDSSIL